MNSSISKMVGIRKSPDCLDYGDIILSIAFFASFIAIFFFTYGTYIEGKVVDIEINYLVNYFGMPVQLLNADTKKQLADFFNNIAIPDTSEDDATVKRNNAALKNKAYIIIGIILAVALAACIFLSTRFAVKLFGKTCGFNIWECILKNCVIIILIGLTEFIFLTFYGSKYMSADPNVVMTKALQALRNYKLYLSADNAIPEILNGTSNTPTPTQTPTYTQTQAPTYTQTQE